MTLVVPFGCDQVNNPLFSNSNTRNSSMPCVFDGEALDFESALMTDWTSDISDYDTPADDFPTVTPSDSSDLKRKIMTCSEANPPQSKKLRIEKEEEEEEELVDQADSDVSSTSSLSIHFPESNTSSSNSSSSYHSPSSLSSLSSSSSSTSSEGPEDGSSTTEDEDYLPRRRCPQMWNSRQRLKDERKKVLKMSVTKLSEIEDPELCLLRSVLINNTIKKLHYDIRNDRQAKLRQRQQRIDFYAEKFQPLDVLGDVPSSDPFSSDMDTTRLEDSTKPSNTDLYDDTSCDEIFGISEDFLRVAIPDRRVSSPIPTSQRDNSEMDTNDVSDSENRGASTESDTRASSYSAGSRSPQLSTCDNPIDCASSRIYSDNSNSTSHNNLTIDSNSSAAVTSGASSYSSPSRRPVSGGSQCATQYRTNRDLGIGIGGESVFPPRVPIIDSVVYHSLLASLESS